MEVGKFRQYTVKMDGSRRLSQRNRRHLQKIHPSIPVIPHVPVKTATDSNNTPPDSAITSPDADDTHFLPDGVQAPPINSTPETSLRSTTFSDTPELTLALRRSRRTHRKPKRYCDESCM